MGKKVSFSLDCRPDRRGEHPIRLYVRSCDGHRFQSTVGYSIAPGKWDSGKQRAIVGEESDSTANAKGIPLAVINDRIDAISKAFKALIEKPGASTKSALAAVLDRITSENIDNAIPKSKSTPKPAQKDSSPELPNSDQLSIIKEFLSHYHDFASKDRRKGFVNVYRPEWHKNQVRFWFNPPFGKKNESLPITSGAVMMKRDGTILVQEQEYHLLGMYYGNPGKTYDLSECLGESLSNFVYSIMAYKKLDNSFRLDGLSCKEVTYSFVIPEGQQRIDSGAFKGCTGLKEICIPNSVTEIGQFAFSECIGLTEIHIPDSVTIIERSAFEGCTGLRAAYLPNVTKIGQSAFSGCTGLTEIRLPDNVIEIDSSAFAGCPGFRSAP